MRLLLDTHIWIWSLLDPGRLSRRVSRALQEESNELWLSPISVWELTLLAATDRLELESDVDEWVAEAMNVVPLREAPITHDIALETIRVALPHQDPADRLLAATARVLDLALVTADERLIGSRSVRTLANR